MTGTVSLLTGVPDLICLSIPDSAQ